MSAVITDWTAVSPYGRGRAEFAAGILGDRTAVTALDPAGWTGPPMTEVARAPIGAPREVLGRKGTRAMDRATAMAVLAAGDLLPGEPAAPDASDAADAQAAAERTALVLGISTGPVAALTTFTADSFTGDRPYLVDAARFPAALMNYTAGQMAIWHHVRGPNSTVAAGRTAGLAALRYALRLLRAGRADTVLCGAVEEFSAERAWLEWHAAQDRVRPPVLGEGCAMLRLTRSDLASTEGAPVFEVAAVESGLAEDEPRDAARVLERCARSALAKAGVTPDEIGLVVPGEAPDAAGEAEADALAALFGGRPPRTTGCARRIGDTRAASAAFQMAAVLAHAERAPGARPALITTVDRDGPVACAVLRPAARQGPDT
ncbi:beta-ketoacyl synthase N-terminal-like domain-containing protein [Actinomadura harenae]|uniref:beta-ketoacyl synthase N-terminal-like domain-containing protein n=1 Tax=Actinomadura harenae TaxID=2483351 RepID=UPI0018F514C7|nr:beta-ketoacyl synthase N-terminal-like domain-containing protein [Actinomadura harenae]